jgi:hypothetical protein
LAQRSTESRNVCVVLDDVGKRGLDAMGVQRAARLAACVRITQASHALFGANTVMLRLVFCSVAVRPAAATSCVNVEQSARLCSASMTLCPCVLPKKALISSSAGGKGERGASCVNLRVV